MLSNQIYIIHLLVQSSLIQAINSLSFSNKITIQDHINNNQSNQKQLLSIQSYEISPIKGIILPQDSQLIKINAIIPSQNQSRHNKKLKYINSLRQFQIAQLNINCSYFLQYNKQKIVNKYSQDGHGMFQMKDVEQSQMFHMKIFIQADNVHNQQHVEFISNKNSKQNYQNNQVNKSQVKVKNKSSLQQFKQKVGQLNLNTIKSANHIKDFNNAQDVNFQNSGLNDDYNFIKNKLTLRDIQQRKPNQIFKVFQNQSGKNSIARSMQQNYLNKKQKSENTIKRSQWKISQIKNKNNQNIQESIVIESYSNRNPRTSRINNDVHIKLNNKSMEIIVLAVIAAIFVSLGSNFKMIFFNQ